MNEAMRLAWLEISQMLGEPTREELDVFLRTWQRAIQAEREVLLDLVDDYAKNNTDLKAAIRARGNT
jgi:hypothetical protein